MGICVEISARQKHYQTQKGVVHFWLLVLLYELAVWEGAHSWNYNYSTTNMTWPNARNYCQSYFTDLVAIQNSEENNYLNMVLPQNPTYYWIGIRRVNDIWTWVGTNKTLTKEAENWAKGEPTFGEEDCVEIYIKRDKDSGMWNNDPCLTRWKRALCYLASCKSSSCSSHGECMETIGNYTCRCYEGFYGSYCEFVMKCEIPKIPRNGTRNCSHPIGNFSYHSTCDFGCVEGFSLNGSVSLQCEGSGMWSSRIPACEVEQCSTLNVPDQATMNCTHPNGNFSFDSTCDFQCAAGFTLHGSQSLWCNATGIWTAKTPSCEVMKCEIPKIPRNGTRNCSHPIGNFSYHSTCDFGCVEGFSLNGSVSLQCEGSGMWSSRIPACEGTVQEQHKSTKLISTSIAGTACLFSVPFVIWLIKHYRKKVMQKDFSPVRT
ncbi:E-selectin-like isoform X1 [Carcharodon carcharias]|uniref:E-selectin-like isoform X1 n=2 Tax=Carcharodon carcharias TaxID=13397 RepID=UPI001B7F1139|nr:E-selectin-like isoform X1 [Carcharodon carcharias]